MPTADELLARLVVAAAPPVRGRFRCVGGMFVGFSSVRGSPPYLATTPDGARFVVSGARARVTDDSGLLRVTDGVRIVVRDAEQGLVEVPRLVVGLGPERHLLPDVHVPPSRVLRPHARTQVTVAPTTWAGRRCWSIAAERWTDVVDDETSVVWRYEQRDEAGTVTGRSELIDLDLTASPDADDFEVPDAPAWVPPPNRMRRVEAPRTPEVWGDRPLPTVAWSPDGPPHSPHAGDLATGHLVQQVRLHRPGRTAFLLLHRIPAGGPQPAGGHRWSGGGWDWVLEEMPGHDPVSADELAAMAASVDVESWWPTRCPVPHS